MTEAEQNRLIIDHMHLVPPIAADYRGEIDFDDLVGIGREGLVKAAKTFDGKTSQFPTWAITNIRGEISNAVNSGKYDECYKEGDDPAPPTDGDSIEKIYEWDAWGEMGNAMAVSEAWARLDSTPEDLVALYGDIKDKRARFQAAFISLTGNQRNLIRWVFLDDCPRTIPEAARELGVSRFQAGRMLKKALKIMREVIARMETNSGGKIANGHPSIAGLHGCAPGNVAA